MTATALHGDQHPIRRRHQGTGLEGDEPCGRVRRDVDGEGSIDRTDAVEKAVFEHEPGTVVAFFAGLEHQQHAAVEFPSAVVEQLRRTGQHRHMEVVATSVHRVGIVGREVDVGVLVQRKRVHVGTQQDRRTVVVAVDRGRHACGRRPAAGVESERRERVQEAFLGPWKLQAELGIAVEVAAQRCRLVEEPLRLGEERGVDRVAHVRTVLGRTGRVLGERWSARRTRKTAGTGCSRRSVGAWSLTAP